VRELASDLGVRYALEGSVRRLPGGLRVTAQLIETATRAHLWAEKYDRVEGEFAALHDDLCRAIVFRLGAELTRAEMNLSRRKPPAQWSVWELYQQAQGTLQFSGWSRESFTRVVDLLRRAIGIDPAFAPAQAYLAQILALGHWARLFPDLQATLDEAVAAGDRAMALAPDSSEVLGYVGCALSDLGQHERGIPIIERAIELNPSNAQAFAALGAAKLVSGRLEEGTRDLRHAMAISPADPGLAPWSSILSIGETYLGNLEQAQAWADRARKADPRYFGGYLALAMARDRQGRPGEAQRALAEARRLNPDLSDAGASAMVGEAAWTQLRRAGIRLPEAAGACR
jgi:adenylate cyclase